MWKWENLEWFDKILVLEWLNLNMLLGDSNHNCYLHSCSNLFISVNGWHLEVSSSLSYTVLFHCQLKYRIIRIILYYKRIIIWYGWENKVLINLQVHTLVLVTKVNFVWQRRIGVRKICRYFIMCFKITQLLMLTTILKMIQ